MEKNYYDETIDKIDQLIADKDYETAYGIVITELGLPYVPEMYLPIFLKQKQEILQKLKRKTDHKPNFTTADLFSIILNRDVELTEFALSELENSALINHLDKLDAIFQNEKLTNEIKGLFYEMACKQKIDHNFVIYETSINPLKNLSVGHQPSYLPNWNIIETKCEKDQTMINAAYFIYNKYLLNNFWLYVTNQLKFDITNAVYELALLYLRKITEQDLSADALKIMNIFLKNQ
ncbi:DUF3196 family protein [Candidatus Mycoplasma pogonae]